MEPKHIPNIPSLQSEIISAMCMYPYTLAWRFPRESLVEISSERNLAANKICENIEMNNILIIREYSRVPSNFTKQEKSILCRFVTTFELDAKSNLLNYLKCSN